MKKIIYAFKRLFGNQTGKLSQKWKFDSKSIILTTPIVAETNNSNETEIFFGTKEGKLFSLDTNANIKWIFDSSQKNNDVELMFVDTDVSNSIKSTPNVVDINNDGNKEIVFGSESGILYCLENNGKLKWSYDAKSAIRGSPLIIDLVDDKRKEVVFGTLKGDLIILSPNGELINKFNIGSGIETKPCWIENKFILGNNAGEICAYSIDGKKIWTFKTGDKISANIEITNLQTNKKDKLEIIVGSEDGKLYVLSLDGEIIWTFKTNGAIMSKVAIEDINKDGKKEIVFGSCDNNIYCLNSNGEKIWSYETGFWVVSTPIIKDIDNDGHIEIIAGSYDHNLYVLDSEGSYMLNYIPGLSGIINQTGTYSNMENSEFGNNVGKKLWQFKTDDIIIGCAEIKEKDEFIVNTKSGKISNVQFSKEN
jgi:outer membrane protein assembly factor BamB